MKTKKTHLILLLLVSIFIYSCGSTKKTTDNKKPTVEKTKKRKSIIAN